MLSGKMALVRKPAEAYKFLSRTVNINKFTICHQSNLPLNHYNVIIAGGGMVGTALACTLGKNTFFDDKKILLLDQNTKPRYNFSELYSNRVVALNENTRKLFTDIGVWKHISEKRYGLVRKLQVWDAISDSMITFTKDDMQEPIAYIVENDLIIDSLLKETEVLKNVEIQYGVKVKEYKLMDHKRNINTLLLDNLEENTCDLLLGCDGFKSKVRQTMNVHYLSWEYGQMAVVATLKLANTPDNHVAWQRFLPTGPIALLPLKEDLSSLVWSTSPEHAKELLKMNPLSFIDAVNNAMWKQYDKSSIISNFTNTFDSFLKTLNIQSNAVRQLPPTVDGIVEGSTAAFPLGFGHSSTYVQNGVALVGDAAHRIHPLAGQGVNLGFGDVSTLDKLLGESIYLGNKLGDLFTLREYERERQMHNVPTMIVVDALHKMYTTQFLPVVLLRSLGLQFTHALKPLKNTIINQAAK